jgi:hypothetical protein
MLRIGGKTCPYCGRAEVYISYPKRVWEELAILLLLRPVRCHDCMRRFYRPLFMSTPMTATKKPSEPKRSTGERSISKDHPRRYA